MGREPVKAGRKGRTPLVLFMNLAGCSFSQVACSVKQVKLPRCSGQGSGLSPVSIPLHYDISTRLGLQPLQPPRPFFRGKAWQETSDEGWLRLGTHTIPLCLSRADICNHLPSCWLSPDGWLSLSQMAATTIGSQITLPSGPWENPESSSPKQGLSW